MFVHTSHTLSRTDYIPISFIVLSVPTYKQTNPSALSEWEFLRQVIRSGHGGAAVKALAGIKQRSDYAEDTFRCETKQCGRIRSQ